MKNELIQNMQVLLHTYREGCQFIMLVPINIYSDITNFVEKTLTCTKEYLYINIFKNRLGQRTSSAIRYSQLLIIQYLSFFCI